MKVKNGMDDVKQNCNPLSGSRLGRPSPDKHRVFVLRSETDAGMITVDIENAVGDAAYLDGIRGLSWLRQNMFPPAASGNIRDG